VIAAHYNKCTRCADNPKDTSRSPSTARRLGKRFQWTVYKNQRGEDNIGVNAVRKVKGWEKLYRRKDRKFTERGRGLFITISVEGYKLRSGSGIA
jgi:hypothetical protein